MKKIVLALTLLVFMACTKQNADTILQVNVTQNPISSGQTVSATFLATIHGGFKPVKVRLQWYQETANKENPQLLSSTEMVFDYRTTHSICGSTRVMNFSGLYNYYWARLIWDDAQGRHVLDTEKAYCRPL